MAMAKQVLFFMYWFNLRHEKMYSQVGLCEWKEEKQQKKKI